MAIGLIADGSMAVGFSQRIRDAPLLMGDFSPFIRILTNDILKKLSEYSIKTLTFQGK